MNCGPYDFDRRDGVAAFCLPPDAARGFARFGTFLVALFAGVITTVLTGIVGRVIGNPDWAMPAGVALAVIVAGITAAVAYRRFARGPKQTLTVEVGGRVVFDGRELVAAGTATGVQLFTVPVGEDSTGWAVAIGCGGKVVRLPVPGLGTWGFNRGFRDGAVAEQFAAQVAESLAVPVVAVT